MKGLLWLFACFSLSVLVTGHPYAVTKSDPRFFGTYCGETSIEKDVKIKVKAFGFTLYTRTETRTFHIKDIRAKLNYTETIKGGLVDGFGTATLGDRDLAFVVAGVVVDHGKLRGSITVAGLDSYASAAHLSEDGLAFTIYHDGKPHTIRKDACGNTPPQVTITQFPSSPIQYGQIHFFRGEVSDVEDLPLPSSEFAPERLVWTYDDVGLLQKSPSGLRAWTKPAVMIPSPPGRPEEVIAPEFLPLPTLPPGNHKITFSATDSGGLTSRANVQVTVINDPPQTPTILLPKDDDMVRAGCGISFLGQAYDVEDGFITGTGLAWSSGIDGLIGHGTELKKSLDTPGTHVIRLTATDSVGASSFAETTVTVEPASGGCGPIARIVAPPYHEWKGPMAISSGEKLSFVGTAEDSEDLPDELDLEWKQTPIDNDGDPIGPELDLGDGSTTEKQFFVVGVDELYEITFRATDSDGNTGEDKMEILVLSQPIE